MIRYILVSVIPVVVGVAASAEVDCTTVNDDYLEATALWNGAPDRAEQAAWLGGMSPVDLWFDALNTYFAAHIFLMEDTRVREDAEALFVARRAMVCWREASGLTVDEVRDEKVFMHEGLTAAERSRVWALAKELVQ